VKFERDLAEKCELHPLIYTLLGFAQEPDVEKKKAEPKTPHFLSVNRRYCRLISRSGVWIKVSNLPKKKAESLLALP
jgi:hypothetical protein